MTKKYKLKTLDNVEITHGLGTYLSEAAISRATKPEEIKITGTDIISLISKSEYLGEL
jgi:hypothetical protein